MNGFRVIEHQPVCPDCASNDVSAHELTNADGTTETALICGDCGAAWPLACITEQLETRTREPGRPGRTWCCGIDAWGPGTEAARRWYWLPACDTYLHGDELATAPVLRSPPARTGASPRADLTPQP